MDEIQAGKIFQGLKSQITFQIFNYLAEQLKIKYTTSLCERLKVQVKREREKEKEEKEHGETIKGPTP